MFFKRPDAHFTHSWIYHYYMKIVFFYVMRIRSPESSADIDLNQFFYRIFLLILMSANILYKHHIYLRLYAVLQISGYFGNLNIFEYLSCDLVSTRTPKHMKKQNLKKKLKFISVLQDERKNSKWFRMSWPIKECAMEMKCCQMKELPNVNRTYRANHRLALFDLDSMPFLQFALTYDVFDINWNAWMHSQMTTSNTIVRMKR